MRMVHSHELDINILLYEASRIKQWTIIDEGKYEGLTIPELVFGDLGYFYWAISVGLFEGQLKLEADSVESRLKHIKLPLTVSPNSIFVIQLRNGMFYDFSIQEKGSVKGNKSDLKIASHLDVSLVSCPGFHTERPRKKMLERVKQYLFTKEPHELGRKDYQVFLGNPDNSDTACCRKHLSDVPRWDDPSILAETLRNDAAIHSVSPATAKKIEMAIFHKRLRKRERSS